MRYIIKDKALKEFSWKGTRDKDPFMVFSQINETLKDAIDTPDVPYTDYDHNKAMIVYVKQAPFRFQAEEKKRVAQDNEFDNNDNDNYEYDDDNNHEYEDENEFESNSDN